MGSVFSHLAKAVLLITLLAQAGSVQLVTAADAHRNPTGAPDGALTAAVPTARHGMPRDGAPEASLPGASSASPNEPLPDPASTGAGGASKGGQMPGAAPQALAGAAGNLPSPEATPTAANDPPPPETASPVGNDGPPPDTASSARHGSSPDGPPDAAPPALPAGADASASPALPFAHLGEPLYAIATTGREIVLTIDDGPSALTGDFLAILAEEEVPAVFFWLTGNSYLPLAADVVAQGHQIGTHTISHPRLPMLAGEEAAAEITESQAALAAAAGVPVQYFRPPYGEHDPHVLATAGAQGMVTVLWNVDSRDWALADNPQQIIANVMDQVRPGAIILIHERRQTLAVLRDLIRRLKAEGYTFVLLPPPAPAGK